MGRGYHGERRSFDNGKVQGYMLTEWWSDTGAIRSQYLSIWGGGIMICYHHPMEMRLVKTTSQASAKGDE